MSENTLELTAPEKVVKDYFAKMIEAYHIPIDNVEINQVQPTIPDWFDENKYQRGQQFYHKNRCSVMQSNLLGLIILLAEPGGLDILIGTEKSGSVETSRKRYVETLMHLNAWYDCELTTNSDSWKSLYRVRRLHLSASKSSQGNGNGFISQAEVALTLFGFMGFVISRPHVLGIKTATQEDREGFIHFWACMGHLLGVHDEYNFCLNNIENVEVICKSLLRYFFLPIIQFESKKFEEMLTFFINGMKPFLFCLTYKSQLFLTRRAVGVPGYQYSVDIQNETIAKKIFTNIEIENMQSALVKRNKYLNNTIRFLTESIEIYDFKNLKHRQENKNEVFENLLKDKIKIEIIEEDEWLGKLNSNKLYEMSFVDRLCVYLNCFVMNCFGINFNNWMSDRIILAMKKWHASKFPTKIY